MKLVAGPRGGGPRGGCPAERLPVHARAAGRRSPRAGRVRARQPAARHTRRRVRRPARRRRRRRAGAVAVRARGPRRVGVARRRFSTAGAGSAAVALVDVGPGAPRLRARRARGSPAATSSGGSRRSAPTDGTARSRGSRRRPCTTCRARAGAKHDDRAAADGPPLPRAARVGVRRITGATVLGGLERPDARAPAARRLAGGGTRRARRSATLDFGVAGVPVDEARARGGSPARYDRPVSVDGSNDRRTFVFLGSGRMTRAAGLRSTARRGRLAIPLPACDDRERRRPPLRGLTPRRSGRRTPHGRGRAPAAAAPRLRRRRGAPELRVRAPAGRAAGRSARPIAAPAREGESGVRRRPGPTIGERYGWLVQALSGSRLRSSPSAASSRSAAGPDLFAGRRGRLDEQAGVAPERALVPREMRGERGEGVRDGFTLPAGVRERKRENPRTASSS